MPCDIFGLFQYETNKLVRIKSGRLGSLKWTFNTVIFMFICIMMFWNKEYQEHDLVVSSVTTKVKGVVMAQSPDVGAMLWDVVDHSGIFKEKNSFFVVTNVIITKRQKLGTCPEVLSSGKRCFTDKDCEKGYWDQHSHGVQTGACVKFDTTHKTCEVSAWCPIETTKKPPRPALFLAAENFTVLIKNNIRFPAFNYFKRNILPEMTETYLKGCMYNRQKDPLCPIFRLGDIVKEAKENFTEMAVEGGIIGVNIKWNCDLDQFFRHCRPVYTFQRLDEKQSNRTVYPGLSFRFARYYNENGVETRTLYKVFGIRFDVLVYGMAGKFSIIQLIIYIGSTLSYYAVTTVFIDWLISTSCYAKEAQQDFTKMKVESVEARKQKLLCVSFVDEDHLRLVKPSRKKPLQKVKAVATHPKKVARTRALAAVLQIPPRQKAGTELQEMPQSDCPAWCLCGRCRPTDSLQEQLCCRQSRGSCLTTSPLFDRLLLSRVVLESVLLYREPLLDLSEGGAIRNLRHCAYSLYIDWRLEGLQEDASPIMPSCCVWQIRDRYPSNDAGQSISLPHRLIAVRACQQTSLLCLPHAGFF
uniref:P2X purinoceptor n=1 Tax=Paramormyrops kingsleyae TaxID=1676925 RepID=A0A3B3QMZ8_9TELE